MVSLLRCETGYFKPASLEGNYDDVAGFKGNMNMLTV